LRLIQSSPPFHRPLTHFSSLHSTNFKQARRTRIHARFFCSPPEVKQPGRRCCLEWFIIKFYSDQWLPPHHHLCNTSQAKGLTRTLLPSSFLFNLLTHWLALEIYPNRIDLKSSSLIHKDLVLVSSSNHSRSIHSHPAKPVFDPLHLPRPSSIFISSSLV
jgi:hypothetical protein